MSVRPEAALALWNDVDPARDDEYEHWHSTEHVPERVWAPGFLGATRYARVVGDGPKYFTLYEIRTLDALGSPQYCELVRHPTPWSASMRPSMSRFVRKPLALSALVGEATRGAGGGIVTVRAVWDVPPAGWAGHLAVLAERLRRSFPDCTRVGGGWVAEAGPQAIANDIDAPTGHEAVFWTELEAEAEPTRLAARLDGLLACMDDVLPLPAWRQAAGHRLLTRATRHHVGSAPRPAPRLDLMNNYRGDST